MGITVGIAITISMGFGLDIDKCIDLSRNVGVVVEKFAIIGAFIIRVIITDAALASVAHRSVRVIGIAGIRMKVRVVRISRIYAGVIIRSSATRTTVVNVHGP